MSSIVSDFQKDGVLVWENLSHLLKKMPRRRQESAEMHLAPLRWASAKSWCSCSFRRCNTASSLSISSVTVECPRSNKRRFKKCRCDGPQKEMDKNCKVSGIQHHAETALRQRAPRRSNQLNRGHVLKPIDPNSLICEGRHRSEPYKKNHLFQSHPCPPSCMRLNSKRWGAPGPPIPVSWLSLCRRCKWFFLTGLMSAYLPLIACCCLKHAIFIAGGKKNKWSIDSNRGSSLAPGGCGSPVSLALLVGWWEVPTTQKSKLQSHWWCATRSGPWSKLQETRTSDRCPRESGHSPMFGEWPPSLGHKKPIH